MGGQCGSCWAFCTTEMIESYAAIETGTLPKLSAQQVTACTPNPLSCGGTGGCYGSIPQLGYTYIQLFGHVSETDYPYTWGSTTETGDCMYDFTNTAPVVGITGYNTIAPNDQDAVMTHLAEVGPLGVAVYASAWGGYSSGVFSGCAYDSNIALNHAVQLVGYGTDAAEGDYWIVRNSWDPDGARVATSGCPGTLRPSAAPTRPQWTALPVLEDPAMMSSTCAASVVSSSTSLGLLAPTTLPCLEILINKAAT